MRFTIVTPSLNQGNFIEETIKSVISQEGDFELEYIIVDGLSLDNTFRIIKRYDKLIKSKKFEPKCKKLIFRWFSEKDSGQSQAINKGFKIASGEIINWLCADDILASGSLQKVANFFKNNKNAKVVFGLSSTIDENGNHIKTLNAKPFSRRELIERWRGVYMQFNLPQPSTFVKKEALKEIGYLDENLHLSMDYEWYLRINSKYKFYFLKEVLSNDRYHSDCKSVKFRAKQYDESIKVSKKFWHENPSRYALSYIIYFPLIKFYSISAKFRQSSKFYNKLIDTIKNALNLR